MFKYFSSLITSETYNNTVTKSNSFIFKTIKTLEGKRVTFYYRNSTDTYLEKFTTKELNELSLALNAHLNEIRKYE